MFSSQRLQLRKVHSSDLEQYHRWRNDLDLMTSTNPALDLYSIDETRHFVENVLMDSNSSKSYMIEDKYSQKTIGITSLINLDLKNRNAECIIDIGEKDYWGKGYGTEALNILLDYAFLELNLHRVSLRVYSFNKAAVHVYHKLGFKEEGKSRQSLYRKGRWHDVIYMGILKDEYIELE
ncbi:GNAT family N-acetyltransferase [Ornithinibacillus sp. L9]|uniref:GNAT family N-acetyltransferase n=1 Tax=Ornithinibacillus caprae TaxID=2678566 RepID=A0A6N8FN73_9BACI|nr:GNAT family protein [Ornithinibacillus caprae]MUK89497.1 GNAT family N-acetyltransferase [Ornithinibacillus caprae]